MRFELPETVREVNDEFPETAMLLKHDVPDVKLKLGIDIVPVTLILLKLAVPLEMMLVMVPVPVSSVLTFPVPDTVREVAVVGPRVVAQDTRVDVFDNPDTLRAETFEIPARRLLKQEVVVEEMLDATTFAINALAKGTDVKPKFTLLDDGIIEQVATVFALSLMAGTAVSTVKILLLDASLTCNLAVDDVPRAVILPLVWRTGGLKLVTERLEMMAFET